jgi:hypothetical protein
MLAENTWILAGFIGVWLAVAVFMDISKYRSFKLKQ